MEQAHRILADELFGRVAEHFLAGGARVREAALRVGLRHHVAGRVGDRAEAPIALDQRIERRRPLGDVVKDQDPVAGGFARAVAAALEHAPSAHGVADRQRHDRSGAAGECRREPLTERQCVRSVETLGLHRLEHREAETRRLAEDLDPARARMAQETVGPDHHHQVGAADEGRSVAGRVRTELGHARKPRSGSDPPRLRNSGVDGCASSRRAGALRTTAPRPPQVSLTGAPGAEPAGNSAADQAAMCGSTRSVKRPKVFSLSGESSR